MPLSSSRSSIRDRANARRAALESASLGLEDELSFGSDEDLMETIGEIQLPAEDRSIGASSSSSGSHTPTPTLGTPPLSNSSAPRPKHKASRSFVRARKDSSASSNSAKSLASTTHLLPPLPPVPAGSTLDLPADMYNERDKSSSKRGSIMGTFKVKSLRNKFRSSDEGSLSRSSLADTSSLNSSYLSLSKVVSNTSSRPSMSSSLAQSSIVGPSSNSSAPHLGPLSLGEFGSAQDGAYRKQPPPAPVYVTKDVLSPLPKSDSKTSVSGATTPSIQTVPSPTSSITHDRPQQSWTPTDLSSSILPAFPAPLTALEPITMFTAEAARRLSPRSRAGLPGSARWSPCTLVFTMFKVTISAEAADQTADDTERTVAHVHVYSKPSHILHANPSGSTIRRAMSNAGFNSESAGRVEIERRWLSRSTTASVCDDVTDADGRAVVMRILWGDEAVDKSSQWLVEMKDTTTMCEWIRQIKKTSIMINAEELGYGRAIRQAFETASVPADELAQQLSLHARFVAETGSGSPTSPFTSELEEELPRLALENQGGALARSQSHDELEPRSWSLGRAHRKAGSEEKHQSPPVEDWFSSNNSPSETLELGLGGAAFSFPAPPSDLPSPMQRQFPKSALKKPSIGSSPAAMSSAPLLLTISSPGESELLRDLAAQMPHPPFRAESHQLLPTESKESAPRSPLRRAPSIASTNASHGSSTSRLRRLRGKPQAIDIMAEFSAAEAENMPPEDDEPLVVRERAEGERRIRFAED